uniref:Uncharacterized protein n=1 Tax=Glycine max TaxID=3847 RepID=C6T8S5_SOYBN|nr:unknown [Glycine max]
MAIPFLPEFPQQNVEKSNRMDVDSFLILHDHFNEVEGAQQVVVERIRDVINKILYRTFARQCCLHVKA